MAHVLALVFAFIATTVTFVVSLVVMILFWVTMIPVAIWQSMVTRKKSEIESRPKFLSGLPLFRSQETIETAKAMREILEEAPDDLFGGGQIVLQAALPLASKEKEVLHAIRVNKHTPHSLAALLLFSVARQMVESGQYHIYRGVLSMNGHGVRAVLLHSACELVDSGHLSVDEFEELEKELKQAIAEVG